ncbi:MAG: hypothetical protein HFG74_11850 [Hungatella sp.]|nr:hypothetical protein [Hungatella sp.]
MKRDRGRLRKGLLRTDTTVASSATIVCTEAMGTAGEPNQALTELLTGM